MVETVFHTLSARFGLTFPRARTYWGLLTLGAVLTWLLYRRGLARTMPAAALEVAGAWKGGESRTLLIVLGASALWLTDSIHHLDPAVPALLALVALLTPGFGPLKWGDLDRGVGWANFFVIGASISLAQALGDSGAAAWLARGLVGALPAMSRHAVATVVLLMVGATALRVLIPNIAGFLALALPVAMSVGREAGLNPLVCALVVMMTGDAVLYFPVQSASSLVIYERGHVTGYWFLDALDDWAPPPGLLDFVKSGPPPLCVGFGSMSDGDAEQATDVVCRALRATGQMRTFARALTLATHPRVTTKIRRRRCVARFSAP